MDIRIIQREDIDKVKWDSCVHYANNSLIYGYLWYLDNVGGDWFGIVEGDYESVMPVFYKEKKGKRSYYQPDILPCLGVYSIHALSEARMQAFQAALPLEVDGIDYVFNHTNSVNTYEGMKLSSVDNYLLFLVDDIDTIESRFSERVGVAMENAEKANLQPKQSVSPEMLADFFMKQGHAPFRKEANMHAYLRVMYQALHRGIGFGSAFVDENGTILASDFFVFTQNRLTSIMPVASSRGKQLGADVLVKRMIIQTHVGRHFYLDFNHPLGGDLGIDFGADKVPYTKLHKAAAKKKFLWFG